MYLQFLVLKIKFQDTLVAQSVEDLTLDFGSGHDLRVVGSSSTLGTALNTEPAWDSLSLPLPLSPTHTLSLKEKYIYTFF